VSPRPSFGNHLRNVQRVSGRNQRRDEQEAGRTRWEIIWGRLGGDQNSSSNEDSIGYSRSSLRYVDGEGGTRDATNFTVYVSI